MTARYAVLMGAGVSVDAGIPSSLALTESVYESLKRPNYGNQSVLFGYVISKLVAKRVLAGGSPFGPINIEEAYDALLRLIGRDNDPLSEFVYSWDPILDSLKPGFDENLFVRSLSGSIQRRRSISGSGLSIDGSSLREAARAISTAVNPQYQRRDSDQIAQIYVDILVSILDKHSDDIEYMEKLVEFSASNKVVVGTLNYDLVFEAAAHKSSSSIDYGLSKWNERQVLSWQREAIKFLKIHGSINWRGQPDKFDFEASAPLSTLWQRANALMIFGGQNSKLTPNGPYLQIRQEFEFSIMRCNRLLVAGYSFGDAHINAILRRWVATRMKAKLVILDPGRIDFGMDVFSKSYSVLGGENLKTVDIVHIVKTAKSGMAEAISELKSRVNLKFDNGRGGMLPHMLVKKIV